jgi:non-specific serine/threonine protein kinase
MARQQTLQALVDWSYGLLSPAEQSVLRRLSVFVGGFTLEAAESVCSNDLVDEFDVANVLHSLAAKSLVVADRGHGSVRFRLLETIRQYSAQKLLDAEGDDIAMDVHDRHADYFVSLAVAGGAGYYSPAHNEWSRTLDVEGENFRAMLSHCAASPSRTEDVLRVFVSLGWYLVSRASYDLVPYLSAGVKRSGDEKTPLFARALVTLGQLEVAFSLLDDAKVAAAMVFVERSLAMAEELNEPATQSRALGLLAMSAARRHELELAIELSRRSIAAARASGDSGEIAIALFSSLSGRIGDALFSDGDVATIIEEVRDIWGAAGYSAGLAAVSSRAAHEAFVRGDAEAATSGWRHALEVLEGSGAVWWARSPRINLALILSASGKLDEAGPLLRQSLREERRSGFRLDAGPLIEMLGFQAVLDGDAVRGARLFGAGRALSAHGLDIGTLSANTDYEDELENEFESKLRLALGDQGFEREYALGTELSVSAAAELALERTRPSTPVSGSPGK